MVRAEMVGLRRTRWAWVAHAQAVTIATVPHGLQTHQPTMSVVKDAMAGHVAGPTAPRRRKDAIGSTAPSLARFVRGLRQLWGTEAAQVAVPRVMGALSGEGHLPGAHLTEPRGLGIGDVGAAHRLVAVHGARIPDGLIAARRAVAGSAALSLASRRRE